LSRETPVCLFAPLLLVFAYLKHDIELLEQVQRRFYKRLHEFHNYPYEKWLQVLTLQNLKLLG